MSMYICIYLYIYIYYFANLLRTIYTGPNLDKKCARLSDAAPSNEILRKIYFVVKPLQKGLNRGW